MKRTLLILALLPTVLGIAAQDYKPMLVDGREWTIGRTTIFEGSDTTLITVKCLRDTIVEGKSCKVIRGRAKIEPSGTIIALSYIAYENASERKLYEWVDVVDTPFDPYNITTHKEFRVRFDFGITDFDDYSSMPVTTDSIEVKDVKYKRIIYPELAGNNRNIRIVVIISFHTTIPVVALFCFITSHIHLKPFNWYFVVRYLCATGARISELLQIKVEHVEVGYLELYGKGGKQRRLYIPKRLKEETNKWLAETGLTSGYLFRNRFGSRITARGVGYQLKQLAKEYGIDPKVVYPHSFRHRFAKNFLAKFNDIALLADLMGHESIETTRIYLRRTASEQQELVDRIVTW